MREVPQHLIRLHVDLRDQLSRASQLLMHVRQQNRVIEVYLIERAMLVLQGRIEGVHLAWFEENDQNPNSDDQLASAAEAWIAAQQTSP